MRGLRPLSPVGGWGGGDGWGMVVLWLLWVVVVVAWAVAKESRVAELDSSAHVVCRKRSQGLRPPAEL